MSEINKIAAALAKAQAVMSPAKMNSTNPFLKNKYADLGSVIEASRKPLADNELSITQLVTGDETRIVVETILMHASGQSISSRMSLALSEGKGMSSAQAAGSIITYLRRYSLSAILGIYADEDADGNEPKQEPRKKQAPAPSEQAIRNAAANIVDMKPETAAALHNAVERKASASMTLETALEVTNSDGELLAKLETKTLAGMANSLTKGLKEGKYENAEDRQMELDAIALILASRR